MIRAVTVWQAAARPSQWVKDSSSGWQVRCSCRSSRPSWWQGPSLLCRHRQGVMLELISYSYAHVECVPMVTCVIPSALVATSLLRASRHADVRHVSTQQLWRQSFSFDTVPHRRHLVDHSCWLQALGAKRRLLASTARSTWMSATVSLAPPYGNLPYGKVLDTLVAKAGLASGPTITTSCWQLSRPHATVVFNFISTCVHDANMQEVCAGDDGLSNVTLAGVVKSGLAGNGICEVGELRSGANSGA